MPRDHHHFPTFQKLAWFLRHRADVGGLAGWLMRSVFTERGLIRLSLYGVMSFCLLHIIAQRLLMVQLGWTPSMLNGRGYPGSSFGNETWTARLVQLTQSILGMAVGELAPLVVVLCLVGLAASARTPERIVIAPPPVTAFDPDPEPNAEPRPPERHPLDPDPGESPPEPRWPRK